MAGVRGRFNDMNSRNGSARNSLLGIDEETNKRLLYAEETEDTYDRENEQSVADLEHKVKQMKKIGEAIEIEVSDSLKLVRDMDSGLNSVSGALDSSMKRLKELTKTASTRHMCYLILFIVVVFLVLYVIFV